LSGGERGRLSLLRLIQEGHNTLLLDEPTNHLDIRSRESLEAALQEFTGTMVVVSHDRRFLEKLVNRLLVFPAAGDDSGSVRVFDGPYRDYVWKRGQEKLAAAEKRRPRPTTRPRTQPPVRAADDNSPPGKAPLGKAPLNKAPLSKNEQKRRQQWIATAEEAIVVLESARETTLAAMAAPDLSNERRLALGQRCGEIETELAALMVEWEKWNLEIEEGT